MKARKKIEGQTEARLVEKGKKKEVQNYHGPTKFVGQWIGGDGGWAGRTERMKRGLDGFFYREGVVATLVAPG